MINGVCDGVYGGVGDPRLRNVSNMMATVAAVVLADGRREGSLIVHHSQRKSRRHGAGCCSWGGEDGWRAWCLRCIVVRRLD